MKTKVKYFDLHADCKDSKGETHVVTVVGKLEQTYVPKVFTEDVPVEVRPGQTIKGELSFTRKVIQRKLTVGVSICHPTDEFNEEFGIELAKARIELGKDAGSVYTNNVTMLTDDLVMAELVGKLSFICNNIEKYIS